VLRVFAAAVDLDEASAVEVAPDHDVLRRVVSVWLEERVLARSVAGAALENSAGFWYIPPRSRGL
jgi:hypothetical protein